MADRILTLCQLLKAVNRDLFDLIRGILHHYHLPVPGMAVMKQVMTVPGITVSELARETRIAKSHVSNTVDNLVRRGFLEKRIDPCDQRLVRLYAAHQSEEQFREIQAVIYQRISEVIAEIPEERIEALIDGLQVLGAALEQVKDDGG